MREWCAYYELEPFGQERDNWHAAVIASTVANAMRGKGGRSLSVKDFMYRDQETSAMEQVDAFFERFDRMKGAGKIG